MVQMMISLTHMNAIKLFILVHVLLTQVQVHLSTLKKDSNLVTNKKTDILPTQEVQESNTDEHASKDDWSKLSGLVLHLDDRVAYSFDGANVNLLLHAAEEEAVAREVNATHARIMSALNPSPTQRRQSGNSNSTPSEQEAADIMKALKESKKMSKRQPGTEGSNEGTGNILRVPDVSTVVSRASSEGTGSKPGVPDEEKLILKWEADVDSEHFDKDDNAGDDNEETKPDLEEIYQEKDEQGKTTRKPKLKSWSLFPIQHRLAPSLVLATTYIPPTDKDLEILFQPMLDEYFEKSTNSEPVPTATIVNAPIVSTNTYVSTTIAQDAPSTSHSLSSSQVHLQSFLKVLQAGPTTNYEDTLNYSS
ncbi:hypothetical protein Tco_0635180 [Tanacetum coccineum]